MASAQHIESLIENDIQAMGFDLVACLWVSEDGQRILRVLIDKQNGVNSGDCAKVSRHVSGVLDIEEPVRGKYTLEVSSPGIDRPLTKPLHYTQFLGEQAALTLRMPVDNHRRFSGVIQSADTTAVVLNLGESEQSFLFADIEKANLVPKF